MLSFLFFYLLTIKVLHWEDKEKTTYGISFWSIFFQNTQKKLENKGQFFKLQPFPSKPSAAKDEMIDERKKDDTSSEH